PAEQSCEGADSQPDQRPGAPRYRRPGSTSPAERHDRRRDDDEHQTRPRAPASLSRRSDRIDELLHLRDAPVRQARAPCAAGGVRRVGSPPLRPTRDRPGGVRGEAVTAGLLLGRRSRRTEVDLAMALAVLAGCTLLLTRTSSTALPATATMFAALYLLL